ncbi:MAG: magnesium transporter [Ilumatobacter sp.]|nr:MAG: magnesium transporter [Ilumatobacter sp.]
MSDLTTIEELIDNGDVTALTQRLEDSSVLEIADELSRLDPSDTAIAFRVLPRDRALEVFEALDPSDQQQVLDGMRDDRVLHLVENLDPDDRVRLFDELPAKVVGLLLEQLSPTERRLTGLLMGYPEDSVGRYMSPEYVSLRASLTVEQALERIRREGLDAETIYALPVLDEQRRLIGVTGLRSLIVADPSATIGELMTTEVHSVTTDTDREDAARLVREAGLIALPVVDSERRLVGVLTVDDAMEILEIEETEDFAFHGGHAPLNKPYLAVSAFGLARARGLWLLVLIIAAALTVNVLQFFEDTLESAVVLALFIPLLIDTGGNSGAQASTVVIRAMAVGEVRFTDLPRIVWRETRVGVLLGLMLATVVFVPVAVIYEPDLAFVVSATLVTICTWATIAGSALPLLAKRVGVDPAVVSAPVITTLVDATGLIIYFVFAISILGL